MFYILLNNKMMIMITNVTLHQVHHHPALKLKTPIAYQKDTDLNAIPIMREGMGRSWSPQGPQIRLAIYVLSMVEREREISSPRGASG